MEFAPRVDASAIEDVARRARAQRCLKVHGGFVSPADHAMEQVVRGLRVHRTFGGTNQIMRATATRAMLAS